MPKSHRWVETIPKNSMISNKYSYCIFVWSKNLSTVQVEEQGVRKGGGAVGGDQNYFWNYSNSNAIRTDK